MASLRLATCADIHQIAAVQVATWRTTYRGIVTDEFLDNASAADRIPRWERNLCDPESKAFVVVAEAEGQVIGFAAGGPESSSDPDYTGELYALYLLQAYQRQGIGRQLVSTVAERLTQAGLTSMLIWVLAANSACRFYEACGGQQVRQRVIDWGGKTLDELGYGWPDTRLVR